MKKFKNLLLGHTLSGARNIFLVKNFLTLEPQENNLLGVCHARLRRYFLLRSYNIASHHSSLRKGCDTRRDFKIRLLIFETDNYCEIKSRLNDVAAKSTAMTMVAMKMTFSAPRFV